MIDSRENAPYSEIRILWDHIPPEQLKKKLNPLICKQGIDLEIQKIRAHGAIADPIVLVAIVSGASSAITAIIMGLFKLLDKTNQKIVIQAQAGSRLEIPKNTSKKKIEELIGLMHQMEVKRVRVMDVISGAEASEIDIAEQND